ncbi:hypothetical protein [Lutispora thermophila]|uniref:YceG-like family protein n=1 Tax=Lutispora thermophila DSM 19022 TaxID=1122184 RepID=A0A1M6G8M7_9FIRM|nr:hypothetical protein [Lutispora thermophila]SHJ06333.1 hypothetical protein SAMN02745176_02292 [Lutispora thermophila DSM 19022]
MKVYDIKGIILGIGIGLVFSSIVNINMNQKAIDDDFIRAEASKRGFIILKPEDLIDKDRINEDIKTKEEIEGNMKSNEEDENSKKEDEEISDEEISFEILKGYNSYDTAEVLLNSGLISDKDVFINRIRKRDKQRNIQTGVFIIKKGTSIDDIINIITTPRNKR